MVAMSVTAVSFGRMAAKYPSSGSVYTYIALNPYLGFIVGWAMFLEYLFQPIQNALYAVLAVQRIMPRIPFAIIAALAVGLITLITVQGIKFTARTDEVLLGFMVLITAVFLVAAVRHIVMRESYAGLTIRAADLQSGDIQSEGAGGWHVSGGAGIHRIRWRLNFGGGSEKSEAERPARLRPRVRVHRTFQRTASLPGAAGVAGLFTLSKSGDSIHGCCASSRRTKFSSRFME